MERETEQPLLAAARDLRGQVEERRRQQDAVADDPDLPALLDDIETARAVAGVDDVDREPKPDTNG